MSRLSFFLLGLAVGVALTTLRPSRRDPHSQLPKGFDHESKAIETAAPTIPFTVPHGVSSARIEVEKIKERPAQADILNMIANFKTAQQIIFETNEPARRLFNELR